MSGAISLARVRRLGLTPVLCAVPLGVVIVCAMASDVLVPDATKQDMALGVVKPGVAGHLLGTDKLGRDIFQMAVAGARSAVVGPVCIALGSMVLGVVLGTMAGYFGGWLDVGLTKYADLLLAMPTTLIALVVAGLVGGGYWVTVAVLMVLFSPTDIRLVRSAVMTQATRPYIESAKVLGLSNRRIMFRHILPNVAPVALATMLLNVAFALVGMSALSFLGLGVGPGEPDWGRQLSDARKLLTSNPAAVITPGVLIIVTAAAINLLGDWLQERAARQGRQR
ncbi:MAG: ABC transporter permease [Ilumatobacteraceae bacterium]